SQGTPCQLWRNRRRFLRLCCRPDQKEELFLERIGKDWKKMKLEPIAYDNELATGLVDWPIVAKALLERLSLSDDQKSNLWRFRKRADYWVWDESSKEPINRFLMHDEDFEKWESGLKELPQTSEHYQHVNRIGDALRNIINLRTWIVYPCSPSEKIRTSRKLEELYPFNQIFWQLTGSEEWPVPEAPHLGKPEDPLRLPECSWSMKTSGGDCSLFLPCEELNLIL
ncbi:MAG: hypothetical protein OQK71_00555, partial [Desulfobacter sp.]|nr:hypothetical protein [Desulfobacter sp.]